MVNHRAVHQNQNNKQTHYFLASTWTSTDSSWYFSTMNLTPPYHHPFFFCRGKGGNVRVVKLVWSFPSAIACWKQAISRRYCSTYSSRSVAADV